MQDPVALQDRRVASLIQYAMKVEKAMFEAADSKKQYYEFLAAKIYRIRKELEERRRMKTEMESKEMGWGMVGWRDVKVGWVWLGGGGMALECGEIVTEGVK